INRERLDRSSTRSEQGSEVVERDRDVWVSGPEQGFLHPQGAPVQAQRTREVASRMPLSGEVVERDGNLIVLWTERSSEHDEGPSVETLCFGILPLAIEQCRERHAVGGNAQMMRSQGRRPDCHRTPSVRFALRVATRGMFEPAEVVIEGRDVRVSRA